MFRFNVYSALVKQGNNNRDIIKSVNPFLKINSSNWICNWPNNSQLMDYKLKLQLYKGKDDIFHLNIIYHYLIQCAFKKYKLYCPKYIIHLIAGKMEFYYKK